jgi:threonine/homoserine/homoserine lactone efflux protein
MSNLALWRRGAIMNLTNPKVQIFFLAFFPQFVTRGAGGLQTAVEMTILGVTFMAATALVFGLIALGAGSVADRLRTSRVQFWLNRTAAVIFCLLAAGTVLAD